MAKKKLLLMILSAVLAIVILSTGIVTASLNMSKQFVRYTDGETQTIDLNPPQTENDPPQDDKENNSSKQDNVVSYPTAQHTVALEQGYVKPVILSSEKYGIVNDGYRFEIYKSGSSYKTRICDKSGKVVEEQVNPINIQIKRAAGDNDYLGLDSETQMISAGYSSVSVKQNTIFATATVKSKAGSVFAVTDQYIGSKNGKGFELIRDIQVTKTADGDDGFNSIVKFKETNNTTHDKYEYFIPGILIKDGANMTLNAIGADTSLAYVWAKDTRMGMPMVTLRNISSGLTFSLGRVTENAYSGIDEGSSEWLVNKNLQYGSVGFSNTDGYTSADVCYPGMEGEITYQDRNASFMKRSHPVRDDVVHSYRVSFELSNTSSFNEAMITSYQNQFEKTTIRNVDANLDKVYEQTLGLFEDYTNEYAPGKYGMPFSIYMDGEIAATDYCIGFVGQQTSVGFHLIRNGFDTHSEKQLEKGENVIDFWADNSFTEYGFPRVWFGTAANVWAGPEIAPSFIRYMSDGMEGIFDAYLEEKANGVTKNSWYDRCKEYADWLVANQNEDGSYYRAYNQNTGRVYDVQDGKNGTSKNNTTCPVRYLVRMYEQSGNKAYLNAALKAGEFAYTTYYLNGKYYGGTPDGKNVVDKESGVMALYAFTSLYEATGEKKWLAAAESAAAFTASFIYTFDFNVWGKDRYNIYRDKVGTTGLSIISTGGNSTDCFSAYLYYTYFKMYLYTGNEFYYNFADMIENNTKEYINIDGSLPYGKNGLVNEAQSISNQYFNYSVDACLPWCNIAMIDPIASMEDTFGVSSISEARKLGNTKLTDQLRNYGAGGITR